MRLAVYSTTLASQMSMHISTPAHSSYEQQNLYQLVVPWSCPTVHRYENSYQACHYVMLSSYIQEGILFSFTGWAVGL